MKREHDYQIAKDRVKISHFTEQGIDFKVVVHVGTNDGYEIEWYLMMGLKVLGFEPLRSAWEKCEAKYRGNPDYYCCNWGIGTKSDVMTLHETVSNRGMDDSGGSSFLIEISPSEHTHIRDVPCEVQTASRSFEMLSIGYGISKDDYDCLVVDTQGMELDVLISFDEAGMLRNFKGLNVECSRQAWYEGEATAEQVIAWLKDHGFRQDSPIEDHNDIMFVRE